MIDGIKFYIIGKNDFESASLEQGKFELSKRKSVFTDEEHEYPKKGKYENLDVVINEKQAYIKGSLHKYENLINEGVSQNFDNFDFCQMSEAVQNVIDYCEIKNKSSLSQVEIGLNLHLPTNPSYILHHNLLMYKYRDHNKDLRFKGKGDYKEFISTDYCLKIYNKSKQYGLHSNILRIELKILSKRLLRKFGVSKLEDLQNKTNITVLFNHLLSMVNECVIVDRFTNIEMTEREREKLYRYTNPNYWTSMRDTKSPKVCSRLKKDFKLLCTKYNLHTTKITILKKMSEKFSALINCPSTKVSYLDVA